MAKYIAKVSMRYELALEVNASKGDDKGALADVNDVIDNQLPDLAGNYSGGKVEVLSYGKELVAFYDKSGADDEKQKKDDIDLYLASLDSEERELLLEKLLKG